MKKYVLGITGATGPVIGLRVFRELARSAEVCVVISRQSFSIILGETGVDFSGGTNSAVERKIRKFAASKHIFYYDEGDFEAPVASGSFRTSPRIGQK